MTMTLPLSPTPSQPASPSSLTVVTLDLSLIPEHGFVPEPLFDTSGVVSFVLQWGNYLPGLHELLLMQQKKEEDEDCTTPCATVGDTVQNVSVDAGWGERRQDLLFPVTMQRLQELVRDVSLPLALGSTIHLPVQQHTGSSSIPVTVTEIDKLNGTVVLDANPPLAGTSYSCSFAVLSVDQLILPLQPYSNNIDDCNDDSSHNEDDKRSTTNKYQLATFALGCFWGAELAFMRVPGVVGTRVGYTQGETCNPTYEQVCEGSTHHREAVQVVYDSTVVSYETLVQTAMDRLQSGQSPMDLNTDILFRKGTNADNNETTHQYRHGIFFHSLAQQTIASRSISENKNRWGLELKRAATFWKAEEWHQQYLYKGGQSARKGAKEAIRCYG